ncbi:MAG: 4Fe-4S binding protein [Deltaproteobacteria bacterium]|nr:4Fe-4S binding protein [Deltaproteobacteria bacterium]
MPKIILYKDRCKGCALCTLACPKHLLNIGMEINRQGYHVISLASPGKCNGCALCAEMCPDMVIEVWR